MIAASVTDLHKYFGHAHVLQGVSFSAQAGRILGLLGRNGAGKTTSLRILLGIQYPDRGQRALFGDPDVRNHLHRVGYLPEERGLYQDVPIGRTLQYLAELHGTSRADAHRRVDELLERFDLAAYARKPASALSKGMQQKAQLIATLAHDPELLILDEPFSGLDALNIQLVKEWIRELAGLGKAVLMSTHQLGQAEALCDDIAIIDHGRIRLAGELGAIRAAAGSETIEVRVQGSLPDLDGVARITRRDGHYLLEPAPGATAADLRRQLLALDADVLDFRQHVPSLEEIFLAFVAGPGSE
jgi:ABC-2 type transport system ATP-binding protein